MMEVTMWIKASLCPAMLAVLVAACSSSSAPGGPKANVPQPQFRIDQVFGPAEANFPEGPYEVKYRLEIANRADVALRLEKLTISTVNPEGGAYTLTAPHDYYFKNEIPSKSTDDVEFWAKAYGYGRSMRDTEPVTVKGVAYFRTPAGEYVNQPFMRELQQQ